MSAPKKNQNAKKEVCREAFLHIRILASSKKKLQERAKAEKLSLSKYILKELKVE